MSTLDQLPFELLSLILDHVPVNYLLACALVNKRFNQAALPLLCNSLSDSHLLDILEYLPYSEKLYFRQTHFTDATLRQLPNYCPHLTKVKLVCCRNPDDIDLEVTNASMFALAQHRQLTHLTLENMTSLDYTTLLDHFHDCPLMHVRINLPGIKPSARQKFVESATLGLHRHHQQTLTTLHIGYAGDDILTMTNTHQLVWPHLTSFNITDCDNITDAMATTFIQAHPQLQKLGIKISFHLTHQLLITDQLLDNIMNCLPDLLSLDVGYRTKITCSGERRLFKHYDGQLVEYNWFSRCMFCPRDYYKPNEVRGKYRFGTKSYEDDESGTRLIRYSVLYK